MPLHADTWARTPSGLAPARLPTGLGATDLVRRLVVEGRAAAQVPIGQEEARSVPRALDAPVDDRPLRQRAAGVGALLVQSEDRVALPDEDERVDPELRLR